VTRAVSYYAGPEDGEFFSCTPEEYLESLFEDVPDDELEAEVRKGGDVVVVVVVEYRPWEMQSEWVRSVAGEVWCYVVEEFDAEFGSTHNADESVRDAVETLAPVIERLVSRHLCPYWCDEVSRRTWTVDEVLAVVRRRRRRARKRRSAS